MSDSGETTQTQEVGSQEISPTQETATQVVAAVETQVVSDAISREEHNKVQREAQNLRARLKEVEEKAKKLEDEKLSDEERKSKRLEELEASNSRLLAEQRRTATEYKVAIESQKLGIIDSEAAAKLLDGSRLQYDDSGNPTNVVDLLQELITSKPYLKAPAPTASSGAVANPATHSPSNPNTPTLDANFTFQDYLAHKAEIHESMRNGTLTR